MKAKMPPTPLRYPYTYYMVREVEDDAPWLVRVLGTARCFERQDPDGNWVRDDWNIAGIFFNGDGVYVRVPTPPGEAEYSEP